MLVIAWHVIHELWIAEIFGDGEPVAVLGGDSYDGGDCMNCMDCRRRMDGGWMGGGGSDSYAAGDCRDPGMPTPPTPQPRSASNQPPWSATRGHLSPLS